MRSFLLALGLAVAVPAMAAAQQFRAVNHLVVVPLSGTVFEVIEARGEGARGIWCAAADYTERHLGRGGRIYIDQPRGPARSGGARKSVVFTTDVGRLPDGPSRAVSLSLTKVGLGLPVGHAIQFCRRDDFEATDRIIERN